MYYRQPERACRELVEWSILNNRPTTERNLGKTDRPVEILENRVGNMQKANKMPLTPKQQ
jgi:hypothetical protein